MSKKNRHNKSDRLCVYKKKLYNRERLRHVIGYNKFVFSAAPITSKTNNSGASS
jgi:hypothetical protein